MLPTAAQTNSAEHLNAYLAAVLDLPKQLLGKHLDPLDFVAVSLEGFHQLFNSGWRDYLFGLLSISTCTTGNKGYIMTQ